MKHSTENATLHQPSIRRLLPEDRFFQLMADVHGLVVRRAYDLFCLRGFVHGHDVEDWLKAESELLTTINLTIDESTAAFTVKAALSDCAAEDFEIHVDREKLFISAQEPKSILKEKKESNRESTTWKQRCRWMFREVDLPAEIEPDKVYASYGDGLLRIELPKRKPTEQIMLVSKAAA